MYNNMKITCFSFKINQKWAFQHTEAATGGPAIY